MNNKAIFTIGCSASGKSTYAKKLLENDFTFIELNKDNIRFNNEEKNWNNYKFSQENEENINIIFNSLLEKYINERKNIIISNTNLNISKREELQKKLESNGYEIELKYFDIEFEELLKRDRQRIGGVGYEVLLSQYISYQRQRYKIEQYYPNLNKRKCYIVDIDGTISTKCDRTFYEYDKVENDIVIEHIVAIIKSLYESTDYHIIFLTGRDKSCYDITLKWLRKNIYNFITYDSLIMRNNNDKRKDYIVKMELFNKYIRNNYNILAAFDDRKQVIEQCWSVLGVNVIYVGNLIERF